MSGNHCTARKESQFHQSAGCSIWQVEPVEYTGLADSQVAQRPRTGSVRGSVLISGRSENELQHTSSMMCGNG
jgi:hypothetical protein